MCETFSWRARFCNVGGGLIGHPRQPLMEVGIVDGGRGAVVEVGGDHAEQLTVGDQRHHQRSRGV